MEQYIAETAFNFNYFVAGGSFITVSIIYIGAAIKLRGWITKGLIDKDYLEDYLFNLETGKLVLLSKTREEKRDKLKKHYDSELEKLRTFITDKVKLEREYSELILNNHKEQTSREAQTDTDWLKGLQNKIETLQQEVAALKK